MPDLVIDSRRIRHIFRAAAGHLTDTPIHRYWLINTAEDQRNFVGTDDFGNRWYANLRDDGTQLWAVVRGRYLINGGLNLKPRDFRPTAIQ